MASPSQITVLAGIISECSTIVNGYFLRNNLPMPSFDVSGPPQIVIPPHEKQVTVAYLEVLRATMELHHLMLGPAAMLMGTSVRENPYLYRILAKLNTNRSWIV